MKINLFTVAFRIEIDIDFENNVTVVFTHTETLTAREYDLNGNFEAVDFDPRDNTLSIITDESKNFFTLNDNGDLIGDEYDFDDEHIDTIANWSFNE